MGDAVADSESGPPSEVTYQANIATVHVKTESDDKDVKYVSPATRRKQKKNGILKKTTPTSTTSTPTTTTSTPTTRTPAGTTLTTDNNYTVNNNNKESPYQGLVTVTEPTDTTLPNGGVAADTEPGDTDGGHKKVSWSAETVVYTSRVDGSQRVAPRQTNGRAAAPLDDGQWDRRQRSSPLDEVGRSDKTTQKCCVVIAVKLLIIAVVGLVVLGIMYALRFSRSSDKDIGTLRKTLQLEAPGTHDLFTGAWHTSSSVLYLVVNQDIMPWQRPTTNVTFLWHRGASLIVYSIDERGVLRSVVLGDPLDNSAAAYSVWVSPADWHAARLFHKDSYSVFSVLASGDSYNWTEANSFKLQRQYPTLGSRIKAYTRRT
ncbi:hypothetical protein NP493_669g00004 [Ridgeia piscesae]|uniref:DUF985 domain-containing protein n=1 Tax=Ridgeia piscesae TaxID=27915 RepID=A0AAD9KRN2_RIDPI|nr:hypothetical protein NP493_669g00004 [Ridgeia piscesae]